MKNLLFWKGKNRQQEAQLDRLGRELVHAAAASEEELEAALYARIRARVAEKQRAEAEARDFSFSMFAVMRHAVPLMIVTTFVSVLLLFAGTNPPDEPAMETLATKLDRIVLDEDKLPLSSDEVLSRRSAGRTDDGVGGDQRCLSRA